jgi:outer membrane lipoprotein-sorting protein
MFGAWMRLAAVLAFLTAIMQLSGCRPRAEEATAQTRPSPITSVTRPSPTAPSQPQTEADRLWERSVWAAHTVPLKAHVIISRWKDKPEATAERTVLDVITADGGRYRQVYDEPAPTRGRVVVSDGTTLWQYEPSKQTILQRPAPPPASDLLDDMEAPPLKRVIESGSAKVAGRPTQVLTLRSPRTAALRERLWIDTATGRSLKTETFASSGRLVRRVEMTTVTFPADISASAFQPNFPASARTLTAITEQPDDVAAEARRLKLPVTADGYRLRDARRPAAARMGSAASRPTTQLLYSNGTHAVSVFVTEDFATMGKASTPKARPGWQPVTLDDGRTAFIQEEKSAGRTTVVWTDTSHRYTAIAHLPLSELLPAARVLAAATSTAPSPIETASQ